VAERRTPKAKAPKAKAPKAKAPKAKAPKAPKAPKAKSLRSKIKEERAFALAIAAAARRDLRDARWLLKEARLEARANVSRAKANAKAMLVQVRKAQRERLEAIRAEHKAARAAWIAEDAQRMSRELAQAEADYRAEVERIRATVPQARERGRREIEAARALRDKKAAIAETHKSPTKQAAARRMTEDFAQALDVAQGRVAKWADEEPDSGALALSSWDKWRRTKWARAAYRDAVADLRKKHPRGGWRMSDAGDLVAERWIESFVAEVHNAQGEMAAEIEDCFTRAGREVERIDPRLTLEEYNAEFERIMGPCVRGEA